MKNKNLDNNYNISVYAEGPNPTGRDVQNISAMFEVSAFISTVNLSSDQEDFSFWEMSQKYDEYVERKYELASENSNDSFNRLADLVLASLIRMPVSREEYDPKFQYSKRYRGLDREIDFIRNELHKGNRRTEKKGLRSGANFNDLNEWLSEDYGNRLVEISEINTKNSIELIFNICSMGAILGFQHMPEVKDSALYIESIFKGWLSKKQVKGENTEIKLPSLPVSLERTISKYDDVEIEQTKDGWSLKLKRNS